MFHHVKELQFNARVSKPDPKFARLLLEQFGGGNGELKAAMQYFVQAFSARQPYPKLYDMLMDIATEEFSHLEIVGATVTMLLGPVNAELKQAFENSGLSELVSGGNAARDALVHQALMNPQFLVLSGGGPTVTDSNGNPWSGAYVNANGDPTVDLRSDIAAESRAKIVYEYLLQFTDDPHIHESLSFLMTREISHFQMFSAHLEEIQPNFPPGVLQGDSRFTHAYFNMSDGASARGPWNQGQGPWSKGEWTYVEDPVAKVRETNGLTEFKQTAPDGNKELDAVGKKLGKERYAEISKALPKGTNQWSSYPQKTLESPRKAS
ncbi:MAG TPA: manganese catalase family protein [Candidatus Angelobacter sp.]|nr:manganese catalase family protein [Candidatus Angelobacter sp.]